MHDSARTTTQSLRISLLRIGNTIVKTTTRGASNRWCGDLNCVAFACGVHVETRKHLMISHVLKHVVVLVLIRDGFNQQANQRHFSDTIVGTSAEDATLLVAAWAFDCGHVSFFTSRLTFSNMFG